MTQLSTILETEAALGSPWPRLILSATTEQELSEIEEHLTAILGDISQLEVFEPWGSDGDKFELRLVIPDLAEDQASYLLHEFGGRWEVAEPPGRELAFDHGILERQRIEFDGTSAEIWSDVETDLIIFPDLDRINQQDDVILSIENMLCQLFTPLDWSFASDRGESKVQPVVDRDTGRFGIEFSISSRSPEQSRDPIFQERVVTVLRELILEQSKFTEGKLSNRFRLDPQWGTRVVLWFIGKFSPRFPTPISELSSGFWQPSGLFHEVEAQLLSGETELMEVARQLEQHPADIQVARPRWLKTSSGYRFTSSWCGVYGTDPRWWKLHPRLRAVPAIPIGDEERWPYVDSHWITGKHSAWGRLWDGRSGRDRWRKLEDRAVAAWDEQCDQQLIDAGISIELEPKVDSIGRRVLVGTPGWKREEILLGLSKLSEIPGPWASIGLWGQINGRFCLTWFDPEESATKELPTWR